LNSGAHSGCVRVEVQRDLGKLRRPHVSNTSRYCLQGAGGDTGDCRFGAKLRSLRHVGGGVLRGASPAFTGMEVSGGGALKAGRTGWGGGDAHAGHQGMIGGCIAALTQHSTVSDRGKLAEEHVFAWERSPMPPAGQSLHKGSLEDRVKVKRSCVAFGYQSIGHGVDGVGP